MSSSDPSLARRRWLAAAALLPLAGCGFQLRRPPQMLFERIALQGFEPRSPMAAELKRSLASVARVVESPSQAQLVLQALADTRERAVVASTAAGQVRELQVRVRLKFRVITPGEREVLPPDELLQWRDMSYNETNALAKEQEADQLYRAMESDIVAQVMRRLSTAKP